MRFNNGTFSVRIVPCPSDEIEKICIYIFFYSYKNHILPSSDNFYFLRAGGKMGRRD